MSSNHFSTGLWQGKGHPSPAPYPEKPNHGRLHRRIDTPEIIRKYRDLPEAWIAKSILESAEIECFLADDNMVRLDWFYSNLIGGIKLLVRKEDSEAATKLLDESRPERFDVEGVGEYEQPHCPHCGSMDISLDGLDKPTTYAALFVNLPVPVIVKGWKCHACGNKWREDELSQSSSSKFGEQTQ